MEYQIGDFASISRLGIKTLRYYHEIGLLIPSRIERGSGYRFYDESCLVRVRAIQQLKALHFSLAEIAELLGDSSNAELLRRKMQDKLSEIDTRINQFQQVRGRLQSALAMQSVPPLVCSPIIEKTLPNQQIASIRFKGPFQQLDAMIPLLMQTCADAVCGAPFSLFYDDHPSEEDNDIEICVPVSRNVDQGEVHTRQLSGGHALTIIHEGYYDQISLSYQALVDALNLRQLTPVYPTRERYLVGGYAESPEVTQQYRTEIQFQVACPES
ncbi:MAG: MerR family transcriptional regulator [Anaerolineaceae bacterium]|nr:MerR family transcriptional regulator [Anaerolineaceae bacterium]